MKISQGGKMVLSILAIAGLLFSAPAGAAARFTLTDVSFSATENGEIVAATFGQDLAGFDYSAFTGARQNGRPYIAFDIKNATVQPTYKRLKTGGKLISEIDYAQNNTDLVRIVLLTQGKVKAAPQISGNILTIIVTSAEVPDAVSAVPSAEASAAAAPAKPASATATAQQVASGAATTSPSPAQAVRSTAAVAQLAQRTAAPLVTLKVEPDPDAIPDKPLITMNMRDASIWGVLQAFSKETGLNVVIAEGVNGLVSVNLTKVTPREALDAILRPNGYTWTKKGSIIFISTKKLMQSFDLQNIPAAEARDIIANTAPDTVKVAAGKTFNSITVEATPEDMENVAKLIKDIDDNPRQVLVMAKIVEMSPSNEMILGTNIKLTDVTPSGTNASQTRNFASNYEAAANQNLKGFFVKLVGPNWESLIEALETQKDINILASPNIMTLNHQKAQIISGEKLGYRTKTQTETSTVEDIKFLEVGTILEYTAHITDDNRIILAIHPKVSEGEITIDGLPHERTTETTTTIMLNSGETIAIGGLIKEKLTKTNYEIPILGQVPIFGALFRRNENKLEKKEIVVFINPTIVTPAVSRAVTNEGRKVEDRFRDKADTEILK